MIALALVLFLDRTALGKTIRAASTDPDLARLRGINPKTLSTIVWAIAGLLATVAIVLRTGIDGTTNGLNGVGPSTLLRALIAALIGRMTSFRTALLAAVLIGTGETLVRFNTLAHPGVVEASLLALVLVTSLKEGFRGGARVALAPLISDTPIVIASVLYVRAVGDGMAYATAPGAGVLALAAAIAGIVIPRSRWYVLGAITGAAILTVILVVVGVLLLYGILSAYISSGAH